MSGGPSLAPESPWRDACLAAALLAVDPRGLHGIRVRSRAGPVRDRWLGELAHVFGGDVPLRRAAAGIPPARLVGGLDLAATIARGRPVAEPGLLAQVDGGLLVVAMAERLDGVAAGAIAAALDERIVRVEHSSTLPARFALIALDEGVEDGEGLAPALIERLALDVDLDAIAWREAEEAFARPNIDGARARLEAVEVGIDMTEALCAAALSLGLASLRVPLHLLRTARAAAALRGALRVEAEDAAAALRLVVGVCVPAPHADKAEAEGETAAGESPPPDEGAEPRESDADRASPDGEPSDILLEAVGAILPKNLLLALRAGTAGRTRGASQGRAGRARDGGRRGRALGAVAKPPSQDARIDVLATLRQAAPWQRLRAGADEPPRPAKRLHVRKEDLRYVRYKSRTETTAIFAVDASGSAAVERLAETKGAIERLLAECYVRRDSVALIAFRGRRAEALLEPTRSLVRTKRSLSALPGGGGTPLAGGILAALRMAMASERKGQDAIVVFLTDGRGNVALDGSTARDKVAEDLAGAAVQFRKSGVRSILIDTARRPQQRAAELAQALGAEYLAMPQGGSEAMASEVGARMKA